MPLCLLFSQAQTQTSDITLVILARLSESGTSDEMFFCVMK